MFTNYGYTTLGISAVISIVLILISILIGNTPAKIILICISVVFLLFSLYFFRDPDRNPPKEDNVVVSPADGKVLIVRKTDGNSFIGGEAWQISIFMSPLDVHVNRIPINGKVEYLNYVEGEYLVAYHDKADEKNERNEIGIMSKFGNVFFTQVAGLVARRIICELNLGDDVNIGDRFGMIKFGSRVDVLVSTEWTPKVTEGQHVTAGETILYEIK
jgi:phosphatidylserine decarboxylase